MRSTTIAFIGLFLLLLVGFSVPTALGQGIPPSRKAPITEPIAGKEECQGETFGCFEVGLPGIPEDQSIDDFVKDPKPILRFINLAVNAVIAVLVIIGLITIVIGGYIYMTASGDASRVKLAKEMIIAALVGIFLSLVSVIILNTINRYLGSDAEEPTLGGTAAPPSNGGGGGSDSGGDSGGGGGGGGLPDNEDNGGGGGLPDGGGGNVGESIFDNTPPRSSPETAVIIIDENQYYIRDINGFDRPISREDVVSTVQAAQGNTNGIKLSIYRTFNARPAAEQGLMNALLISGVSSEEWFLSTQEIGRK